jgi:hypothetical protein
MAINRPKQGTGPNAGNLQPAFERLDWAMSRSAEGNPNLPPRALLIRFRAAQVNDVTLPHALNV